jgi:hypothetical protein
MHCEAAAGKQNTVERNKSNTEMIACLPNALYACMFRSIDFVDLMRMVCCGALRLGW